MPKANKKRGKKHKKGKKDSFQERQLILKDPKEGQEYAKITKVNGSGRYQLFCFDGKDRLGICAGNIKRRTRFVISDIILVSLWEFQDTKCSIIHKYEPEESRKLKNQGEFPENIKLEEENSFMCDEFNSVQFTYDNPSDEEEKSEEKSEEKDTSESEEEVIDLDDI
jgi:translation initiation factor 1A